MPRTATGSWCRSRPAAGCSQWGIRSRPSTSSSGEVGFGDAVGMAGRPLDQLDPVTVRVGDPADPGPVRTAGKPGRLGCDPLDGKIGEGRVQRLDLDDEVVDA